MVEQVQAGVVGKHAQLTATLVVTALAVVEAVPLVQVPAVWVPAGVLVYGPVPRAATGEVLGPIIGLDYSIAKYFVPLPNLTPRRRALG